jgi:hypothetical protein
MSSSNESHVSFFNSHYSFKTIIFTSTSSDEEILEDMDEDDMAICEGDCLQLRQFFSHHMRLKRGRGNPWMQELVFKTF